MFWGAAALGADIKGVAPGMSTDQAKTALPGLVCKPYLLPGGGGHAADAICRTGISYGNAYADISLWMARGSVGRIQVTGSNIDWASIRQGLLAKYGNPYSVDKSPVTTMGGARIESETLRWRMEGQTIEAVMHVDAVRFAVMLSSDAFEAEDRRAAGPPGKNM